MNIAELELIKEEYRKLSQEISATFNHRLQIIQFGLAFVGIMIGLALESNEPITTVILLSFAIPSACSMILSLWYSEVRRTRRASWYMFGLERRVNNKLGHRVLRWEQDIREPALNLLGIYRTHYFTTAYFFISIAILASIFGMVKWNTIPTIYRIGWPLLFGLLITIIVTKAILQLSIFDTPDRSWPESVSDKQFNTRNRKKRHSKKVPRT